MVNIILIENYIKLYLLRNLIYNLKFWFWMSHSEEYYDAIDHN